MRLIVPYFYDNKEKDLTFHKPKSLLTRSFIKIFSLVFLGPILFCYIILSSSNENDLVLDPHTAIGLGAAQKLSLNDCIVLSTAHPCKFPDATNNAINKHEKLPEQLQHVLDKKENFQVLKNNTEEVKKFVKSKL